MLDSLFGYIDHPAWPILVVVISTFMLEDLAIIGAALLAASEEATERTRRSSRKMVGPEGLEPPTKAL